MNRDKKWTRPDGAICPDENEFPEKVPSSKKLAWPEFSL
jgi:hypothetical protein